MISMKSVVFVCLGNICRSPIAEAVFLRLAEQRGVGDQWRVDSAALGDWHVGKQPDRRAQDVMDRYQLPNVCRARLVRESDFKQFDYVFGMDEDNISELKQLAPAAGSKAKVMLLGEYDPSGERIIRDPYYDDGAAGFEVCYQQCLRCCTAFLDSTAKTT